MRLLPTILAAAVLAACGTKGPLTLPPKNVPPAATKPAPAPAETPAKTPADDSKAGTGAAQ